MVKLTKIYTRGGDKGETSLGDGSRVSKHSARPMAYGTVDEANAAIGLARLHANSEEDIILSRIQNDLFDLGADLCRPEEESSKRPPLRVSAGQVDRLELEIDAMNTELEPLSSFVLPGGTALAAYLHMARTATRRAEREITSLNQTEPLNPMAIKYINRLSDHLFVMARCANEKGARDVLWAPGGNQ